MKTSRFSDTQIIAILKQAEAGAPIPELYRELGISTTTFYKWRSKFGGMDASLMSRLKELDDENRRLKKMYAEERLKAEIITEAMAKNGDAICPPGDGDQGRCSLRHIHPSGLPGVQGQRGLLSLSAHTGR